MSGRKNDETARPVSEIESDEEYIKKMNRVADIQFMITFFIGLATALFAIGVAAFFLGRWAINQF